MGLSVDIVKKLPGFQLEIKFDCEHGIVGILGASGSGKSMLLNCIAGLVKPDEGNITLNGIPFFDSEKRINLPPRERKTGFLFQNYAMFPHLTIAENVTFGLGHLSKEDQKSRATELLNRFHLRDLGTRYPSQISGGQQQRVALARAMAVEPRILLLDEPFSALDDYLRMHMIKEMLASLKEFEGNTLFVTHNIEEAYHLCEKIIVLHNGSIETFSDKEDLFRHPLSLETAKITGCKNIASAVKSSDTTIRVPDWDITATTGIHIKQDNGFAGIRANHISLANGEDSSTGGHGVQENNYPVWIVDESEAPFRTTLYLKFGSAPTGQDEYHIQWEMSRDDREVIRKLPQPLWIHLDPTHVFFVEK